MKSKTRTPGVPSSCLKFKMGANTRKEKGCMSLMDTIWWKKMQCWHGGLHCWNCHRKYHYCCMIVKISFWVAPCSSEAIRWMHIWLVSAEVHWFNPWCYSAPNWDKDTVEKVFLQSLRVKRPEADCYKCQPILKKWHLKFQSTVR